MILGMLTVFILLCCICLFIFKPHFFVDMDKALTHVLFGSPFWTQSVPRLPLWSLVVERVVNPHGVCRGLKIRFLQCECRILGCSTYGQPELVSAALHPEVHKGGRREKRASAYCAKHQGQCRLPGQWCHFCYAYKGKCCEGAGFRQQHQVIKQVTASASRGWNTYRPCGRKWLRRSASSTT